MPPLTGAWTSDGSVAVCREPASIDASSPKHLRQHSHDGLEQTNTALITVGRDQLSEAHDIERCCAFHGLATRDLVVPGAVLPRPASCALCDVPDDRFGRANELIGAFGVPARKLVDDFAGQGEKVDRTLVDIKALEAEHAALSAAQRGALLRAGSCRRGWRSNGGVSLRSRRASKRGSAQVNVGVKDHVAVAVEDHVKVKVAGSTPATRARERNAAPLRTGLTKLGQGLQQVGGGPAGAVGV
jgi:hypothetical protein